MSKNQRIRKRTIIVSKVILRYLLIAGMVSIAASSPFFVQRLMREVSKGSLKDKKKFSNSLYSLRRRGLVQLERDGHDIHLSLTEKGKWITGKFEINDLEIVRPKKWDGKWRVVVFDISHEHRTKRNIFRTKLKELGFYSLQKSVWVHPYECKREIKMLRDFLGLGASEICIIYAYRIENESHLRQAYGL